MRAATSTRGQAAPGHIFVYGTLRYAARVALGEAERRRLRWGGRLVCRGTVRGVVRDLGAYPGVTLVRSATKRVHGEIWRLCDTRRLLALLDAYEEIGAPESFYVRSRVLARGSAASARSRDIKCWIYRLQGE